MSDSLTTKDGIRVAVGQRWRDLDKRMSRTVQVIELDAHNGKVRVDSGAAKSWLSVRRMYRHATGWELVS